MSGGSIAALFVRNNRVLCEKKTRLAGYRDTSTKHVPFDWKKLWKYLKPNLIYFIAAVAVSKLDMRIIPSVFIILQNTFRPPI